MNRKEIYLAGGCFWGLQAYFDNIKGVLNTTVGYANGTVMDPTYEMVCRYDTGYAETMHVLYDADMVNLKFLLDMYFDVIDPTTYHRQGNDTGSQYRTGIYYTNVMDSLIISEALLELQKRYEEEIVVECVALENFYPAEAYHQQYLKKNPNGYCHISRTKINNAKQAEPKKKTPMFQRLSDDELKKNLTPMQYSVTQQSQTEPPFQNAYWDEEERGIFVDVTTGEPLFLSNDKFDSGCGWPSFTKPLSQRTIKEKKDVSLGIHRTEVRSRLGDAHLGHVFNDGPIEKGGLRYCINSASLRFIPLQKMKEEGYEDYISYLEE